MTRTEALEADLQAAVYADPVSDAPRLVYSDWLLEQNDPRGELMALQFAAKTRALTEEEELHTNELIETYGVQWLGPLAGAVALRDLKFDRGFVSSVEVLGLDEDADVVTQHPGWSTLIEMRRGIPASSQSMPLLRTLAELSNRDIVRLANPHRVRPGGALATVNSLSWNGPVDLRYTASAFDDDGTAAISAFQRIETDRLPGLRHLKLLGQNSWSVERMGIATETGITPAMLRWSWEAPVCDELVELSFPALLRHIPALIVALSPKPSLARFILNTQGGQSAPFGTLSTVSRDARGEFTQLEIHHPASTGGGFKLSRYLTDFEQLPNNLFTHVKLTVADSVWKTFGEHRRLRKILKRQRRLADFSVERM